MGLRQLFLYEEETILGQEGKTLLAPRPLLRSLHTLTLLLFNLIFLLPLSSVEGGLGTRIVGLLWFIPPFIYWTPFFQTRYGPKTFFRKITIYLLFWIPIIGDFILLWQTLENEEKENTSWRKRTEAKKVLERQKNIHKEIKDLDVFGNAEETRQKLLSQLEKFEDKEIFVDEIEERQQKLDEIKDDLRALREKRIEALHQKTQSYLDKFLDKYGSGNVEQLKKLRTVIQRKEDFDITLDELRRVVRKEEKTRQTEAMISLLESHDPSSWQDYVRAFLEEFGKGNTEQQKILLTALEEKQIGPYRHMDGSKSEKLNQINDYLDEEFKQLRHEKEIEQFEKELGIEESSSEKDSIDKEEKILLTELEDSATDWTDIRSMDGFEFESFLVDLFKSQGYEAYQTPKTGDQGADVIAEKPFEKIAIQAKNTKDPVSNSAVQEVVGARDYYDCDRAIVASTGGFTKSAKSLAKRTDVDLWGETEIKDKTDRYINQNKI